MTDVQEFMTLALGSLVLIVVGAATGALLLLCILAAFFNFVDGGR